VNYSVEWDGPGERDRDPLDWEHGWITAMREAETFCTEVIDQAQLEIDTLMANREYDNDLKFWGGKVRAAEEIRARIAKLLPNDSA
jgi:hypothetical protein